MDTKNNLMTELKTVDLETFNSVCRIINFCMHYFLLNNCKNNYYMVK